MAIFSQHIKGLSEGGKNTEIVFLDNDTPTIKIGVDDEKGNIVTTKRENTFSKPATFSNTLTVEGAATFSNTLTAGGAATFNESATFNQLATFSNTLTVGGAATFNSTLEVKKGTNSIFKINDEAKVEVNGKATFLNGLTVSEGESTFTNGINAAWFNATSDERAKDEIHRLDNQFIVLREIANWNFYSFNYKSSPQERQIGIIAQEHLDTKERLGFEIVSNPEATGENGDYMCVKEGKIVYLALQAIQALNSLRKADEDQIKSLQKENANLRGKIQDLQKQISLIAEKLKRDFNN